MVTGIHISQELSAIDVLTTLKSFLEQCRGHVLRLLQLYGDQALGQCQPQASQFSKINRPKFFLFQTVCNCKTQVTVEKNVPHLLKYDLVQLRGNSCSLTSLKFTMVCFSSKLSRLQKVLFI